MPNKVSHGEDIKERAKRVLEAILDFQEHNLVGCDNLSLLCEWKNKDSRNPQLLVQTTIKDLVKLSSQDKYEDKLTATQVREVLHRMEDFLEILDDHRIPPKNGNAKWYFTLNLWSKNKETNLREFTQAWQRKWEQRHPTKSKQKTEIIHTPKITSLVQPLLVDNNLKKDIWSDERIEILYKALRLFTDMGQQEKALSIANILLERDELNIPLRREIETFSKTHLFPWRQEIQNYINQEKPFELFYQDASERTLEFTICYGIIRDHEERQYLDCWCVQTEDNQDIPELAHNRCLRLDKIQEATVIPIESEWRFSLDYIKVEMYLFGNLVNAYKTKQNSDDINEVQVLNGRKARRVVRKVYNTFWFFREIFRYGEECVIVSPKNVRNRFQKKLISLCDLYNLAISD